MKYSQKYNTKNKKIKSSKCKAIILLNTNGIKNEAREKCNIIYKKIESSKEIIEIHETLNEPKYRNWLNSTFAVQLNTFRTKTKMVKELEHLIQTVQEHSDFTGCSQKKSYESINNIKNKVKDYENEIKNYSDEIKGEPYEEIYEKVRVKQKEAHDFLKKAEEEFKEQTLKMAFEAEFGTKKQWSSRHQSYEDTFKEFKKEVDGVKEDCQNDANNFFDSSANPERDDNEDESRDPFFSLFKELFSKQTIKKDKQQLKNIYHELVRKLHPDLNPNQDQKQKDLWHQVQSAYKSHDLSQL